MKHRICMVFLTGALLAAIAPLNAAMAQGHGGNGYGHGYGHGSGRGYGPGPIGAIFGVAAAIIAAPFVIAGAIVQSATPAPAYYPQGGGYYAQPPAPAYGGGYYGRGAPAGYPAQGYGPPPGYSQPRNGYGYGVPPDYVPPQGQGYSGPRN